MNRSFHRTRRFKLESLEQRTLLTAVFGNSPLDIDHFQTIRGQVRPGLDFEARTLYVTSDGSGTHTTLRGADVNLQGNTLNVDGVADLIVTRSDGTFRCTGSLLNGGQHVITAAHCLADGSGNLNTSQVNATWELDGGNVTASATTFHVHPGYNGDFFDVGNDIAIVEFSSPVDSTVPTYDFHTGGSELGQATIKVGYGRSGVGSTGDKLVSGTKRAVLNKWDGPGTVIGAGPNQLAYDFDSGNSSENAFDYHFGVNSDLGYGHDEGVSAPGDSGGPNFLYNDGESRWEIAGVTSYGVRFGFGPFSSDVNRKLDSSWGEFGVDTQVSSFTTWISGTMNLPPATPDTTDPILSDIAVNVRSTTATISWTTDEPADSHVNYGTVSPSGSTVSDGAFVTNHSIDLNNLEPNMTYHFQVTSTDPSNNTATSSDLTFMTEPAPAPVDGTVHVGDMSGSATTVGRKGDWKAFVTISLHDANDLPVSNATVIGVWSESGKGSQSTCTTDDSGTCEVTSGKLGGATLDTTFTVSDVSSSLTYTGGVNENSVDNPTNTASSANPAIAAALPSHSFFADDETPSLPSAPANSPSDPTPQSARPIDPSANPPQVDSDYVDLAIAALGAEDDSSIDLADLGLEL